MTKVAKRKDPAKTATGPGARLPGAHVHELRGGLAGVATGPGPRWVRLGLVALAVLYYLGLIHPPAKPSWLRPVAFFTDATGLFPRADAVAIEYRLEVWACGRSWEAIDPRPYFPIRPDDKESRFQRLGYFYDRNRTVMQALDAYISAHHAAGADDGVVGRTGGIRLFKSVRPLPSAGEPVERYHFDPFAPVPTEQRRDLYYTPASERKRRCSS